MKRRAATGVAIVAVALAAGLAAAAAGDGEALFEQALRKERVDGDLKGALEIYQRIVKESAADRPLAARALVQLGKGQEKLGRAEARAAYERVLTDYADQADAVTEARQRLGRLAGEAPTGFAARKVVEQDGYGAPSPDGKYLTYVNWTKGNLAVFDARVGKQRDLTDEGTWDDPMQFADASAWSPDGKQIAYGWFIGRAGPGRVSDLRLIGPDGGKPKVLVSRRGGNSPWPMGWSRDGKSILAAEKQDGKSALVWVDATSGAVTTIRQFEKQVNALSLSPDQRFAAYVPGATKMDATDIRIWTLETGADEPLVEHPANDRSPTWSPDGKWVVFSSDRGGRPALWCVPVAQGKAAGAARLIVEGRFSPMGFASDGTLFCSTFRTATDVYVSEMDFDKGTFGEPRMVSNRYEGSNYNTFWSPDGSKLGIVSRRAEGHAFVIRNVATGVDLNLELKQVELHQFWDDPQWTPDGKSILTVGAGPERGLYLIGMEDGAAKKLLPIQIRDSATAGFFKAFAPNGDLLLVRNRGEDASDIVRIDLKSGAEHVIRRSERVMYRIALSPDGTRLAYFETEGTGWRNTSLNVTSLADGATQTLWRNNDELMFPRTSRPVWLPSGDRLLAMTVAFKTDESQFHVVDARTGEHKPIGAPIKARVGRYSLHPDGKRLAFVRGGDVSEIWAMSNVFEKR